MSLLTLMTSTIPNVWDYDFYWGDFVYFGIIALILLLANVLRRKISFLNRYVIPTAVIGGFLGLGIKYLIEWISVSAFDYSILSGTNNFMNFVTYHAIAIGFIAMGLKDNKSDTKINGKREAVKSGLVIVSTYLLQAFVGLLITIFIAAIFKNSVMNSGAFSGVLLALGFGQGPGQAGNTGKIFSEVNGGLFSIGQDFGLSISTLGFVVACIPGIIYMNYLIKKGRLKINRNEKIAATTSDDVEGVDEIPLAESIDKFTIQISLVLMLYLFTFLVIFGLSSLIDWSNIAFLVNNVKSLIWGFNFLFAMAIAMVAKLIIRQLRKRKIMHRKYTNDYMLNRISGTAFDFMIVSSIMAIDIQKLNDVGVVVALLSLGIIGAIVTFVYLKYICKKAFPSYYLPAFFGFYGMLTGTASTGIALLREVDPQFKTETANDLVNGSGTAIIFGGPLLLAVGLVYINTTWLWICTAGFLLLFGFYLFLLAKISKPSKKKDSAN
ncbi:MAG: hypothetical protein LKF69_00620 [Bacilli bacterium]|nr:hypothetical protein [Bacilli bacterium]MCH4235291.1 hypothetical protein [Bacilli bacterium]